MDVHEAAQWERLLKKSRAQVNHVSGHIDGALAIVQHARAHSRRISTTVAKTFDVLDGLMRRNKTR